MMANPLLEIRIGTMVRANLDDPAGYVRQILPLGFESIQPFFWQTLGGKDLPQLAGQIREAIGDADVTVSSIGGPGGMVAGRSKHGVTEVAPDGSTSTSSQPALPGSLPASGG